MCSWFRKREPLTLVHDELGELVLREGWWSVQADFPEAASADVELRIADVDGKPASAAATARL